MPSTSLAIVAFLALAELVFALPANNRDIPAPIPYCQRFPIGSEFISPVGVSSVGGVVQSTFNYLHLEDSYSRDRFCFYDPLNGDSPVLRVSPGETVTIVLNNMLNMTDMSMDQTLNFTTATCESNIMTPNSVNVHFHGLRVPPTCHKDNIVSTIINPGETFTYSFQIPLDMPSGLYAYHHHVHGISEAALLGGASGVLVVNGIENSQPKVAGLPEQIIVVRDELIPSQDFSNSTDYPHLDTTVNFIPVSFPNYITPVLRMKPNQKQFFRLVNLGADNILNIKVVYDGVDQPLQLVALDGVTLNSDQGQSKGKISVITQLRVDPLNRAEFIVVGPSRTVQNAALVTTQADTGADGDNNPPHPLLTLKADPKAPLPNYVMPAPTAPLGPHVNLPSAKAVKKHLIYFSQIDLVPEPDFFVTVDDHVPVKYYADVPPAITSIQGTVEEWTVENHAMEAHVFHLHQIHFLIVAHNGVVLADHDKQYADVVDVPAWTGNPADPYPSVTLRLDFTGDITGTFVFHCHILEHEDNGMMAKILVLPGAGSTAAPSGV